MVNELLTDTGHIGKEFKIMHTDSSAVQLNTVSQNFCSDSHIDLSFAKP